MRVECRTSTCSSTPSATGSPRSASRSRSCWYRAVTPSSLNVAADVPYTGIWSGRLPNASRLRTSCRPTSRSASAAPRRSNLLIATTSAKSSMSIFSSCEAAPNSGVITYREASTKGTTPASPWPMPGVSTITRSKPPALSTSITSGRCSGSSCAPRVASERKKTRSPSREFIRIRSPSRAPPPLRRVGSTATTATRSLFCWSTRKRRTSSSVSEDLPEPPVPVMPRTGTVRAPAALRTAASSSSGRRPSSAAVIARATANRSPLSTWSAPTWRSAHRSTSHEATTELIIPGRPIRWPSSGEKIVTPLARSRSISSRTMTPPPPPTTRMWPAPCARSSSTRYSKYSTWPPWYDDTATPWTSSSIAASTTSCTERLWPRWMTSQPCDWKIRRMMLMAASWPSKRLDAVTRRTGCCGTCRADMALLGFEEGGGGPDSRTS